MRHVRLPRQNNLRIYAHMHTLYVFPFVSCADMILFISTQRIKSLEMEIGSLELERRMGSREIDTIDNEIRARRQEITNISRKYLNYFYFF